MRTTLKATCVKTTRSVSPVLRVYRWRASRWDGRRAARRSQLWEESPGALQLSSPRRSPTRRCRRQTCPPGVGLSAGTQAWGKGLRLKSTSSPECMCKCMHTLFVCWLLLYSTLVLSWADSLRLHVILHERIAFYSAFLIIHRSGAFAALTWLVPHAAISVHSTRTLTCMHPCSHT